MATLNWKNYLAKAAEVNAEGAVLLTNNGVLPLDKNSETAVFGRIQLDYYKSGTGSGGMVNVDKVTGIVEREFQIRFTVFLDRTDTYLFPKLFVKSFFPLRLRRRLGRRALVSGGDAP